ncbi:hypothetical protein AGMMS49546_37160 [Spirochaetia bacterium]|nr:hypothetical protein AGMMS49546_37160 [Spirochaetia bacterium]
MNSRLRTLITAAVIYAVPLVVLYAAGLIIQKVFGSMPPVMGYVIIFWFFFALPAIHMILTRMADKKYAMEYSAEGFKAERNASGRDAESSAEENGRCQELIDGVYQGWTHKEVIDGQEYVKPAKRREISDSVQNIEDIIKIAPTNGETIAAFNELIYILRDNTKRQFDSNTKILVVIGIVFALTIIGALVQKEAMFFGMGLFFFGVPMALYVLSSFAPTYLIEKRQKSVTRGFSLAGILAGISIGILGSGFTVRTKYSDGSTSDDHSGHFIAWALGLFAMGAVAATMFIWAIINYLRNYVFYK